MEGNYLVGFIGLIEPNQKIKNSLTEWQMAVPDKANR